MASFEKYTQQRKKKEYKGSKSFYGYTMEKTKKASDDIAPVRKDKNTTDLSDEKEEESYFRKKAKNSDSDSLDGGAPYYNPAAKYDKMYGSGAISWDEQAPMPEKETEKQPMGTFEKISAFHKGVKDLMTPEKKNNDGTWFKDSEYFADGSWDAFDLTKTILGSVGDLLEDAATGIIGFGEKALDSFVSVAPYLAQNAYEPSDLNNNQQAIQMHNQAAEASKAPASDFVQKDLYDEEKVAKAIISNPISDLTGFDIEGASIFGEKTDALAQSGGQMLLTAGLQTVGVPWWLTTGVSAFGGQAETALKEGAELDEAILSATVSTGAEILTEKLFGGSGLGEKGLINIEGLTKGITNKVIKTLVDYGVDITAEGFEEVFTEFINNLGTALYKEEKLTDILFSEEALQGYIDSYIGGMAMSGFMNSPKTYKSVKSGTDYRLDLSQNEQKVFDKEYENRLAEETEAKGEALTRKEEVRIYDSVVRDIEKGYIATDTIESVLGGETYKAYKDSVDSEKALQDEFDALNKMKAGEMTGEQTDRRAELKQQLQGLKNNSNNSKLQERLSSEVMELVKDSKLSESYNEKLRRAQKFEADLTKYNGKQLETVKRAVQSGVLNNTNRTHDFVDMIAKISADKGVSFDFTSNQKLKESGFAVEGRTVNGFVKGGKVSLNINSAKALNSVVGHEITHVLEGTELYDVLKESITEYAKSKGEYQKRLAELSKLYEGVENADVEAELIADLVGDYLFTDSDFVSRLLEENPSLFKKIFNEIKYLCKVATAGSKEAKQLEKVKRTFEKAYRETKAEKNTAEGSVRYSIASDSKGSYVKVDVNQNIFDGKNTREMQDIARKLIKDNFKGKVLPVGADGKAYINKRSADEYAYPANRRMNDTIKESKMRASTELDNLLAVSEFVENQPDDGSHPQATGGWDVYTTRFEVANTMFSGEVKIMVTDRGYVFYDITQIKRLPVNGGQTEHSSVAASGNLSNNIISNSTENVKQNGNLSLSAENTAPKEYGNYNVYGDDVMLQSDDIAPVREDLHAAKPKAMTEDIAPVREDIKQDLLSRSAESFGITKPGDYVQVQRQVFDTLNSEGFFDDKEGKSKTVINSDSSMQVEINKKGIKETFNFENYGKLGRKHKEMKLATIRMLPQAIQNGKLINDDVDNYHNNKSSVKFAYIESVVKVEGRDISVKIDIKKSPEKNKFWVHSVDVKERVDGLPANVSKSLKRANEHTDSTDSISNSAENVNSDDIAPVREDITPIKTVEERISAKIKNYQEEMANNMRLREKSNDDFDERIADAQSKYEAMKNKNTKAANNILRRIETLKRRKNNIDADFSKKISDIEAGIARQENKLMHYQEGLNKEQVDRLEGFQKRLKAHLESDIDLLIEEYEQKKASLQEEIKDKNAFISNKAKVLYDEIVNMRKGVRVSKEAGYFLDFKFDRSELKSTLLKVSRWPDTVLNPESEIESIVREAIGRDYESKQEALSKIENELTKEIKKLEDDAKKKLETFEIANRRMTKQAEIEGQMAELIGDTSTWVDKKFGLQYKVNTLRRNLRDIVRDSKGRRDIAKADRIYDELQGKYNKHEAELFREANKIKSPFAEKKITKAEDKYIQMLGELRSNPDTTLSVEEVEDFYEAHKNDINTEKVESVIKEAREVYDKLLVRVNEVLKEHGMQEIPRREGYFPHFTEEKQGFLGKLFNWKTQNNDIPTDIAGMTEKFNPIRSWQSFNKPRIGDNTVYSFTKGFDTYVHGALDWIYHIEDLQKRRAFENHIRYIHSEAGIKEQINAIKNNEEYDADTAQSQIELVYQNARNPLNNFVTDFRTATNTLAGKKSSMDRGMEEATNRKVYSTMTNISNRVSANLIAGSVSSALTNFIPITVSWGQVSPISSLRAMKQTIASTFRDDGAVDKSDFLTTRLRAPENLYQTTWDKIGAKVGWLMESIDSFTSQTVWRSKYIEDISKGMSESEAIKNADQFAENVIAGRSRGNNPTAFDTKNILWKTLTAFQLEVNNNYGYMFKDMPQDMANESKAKLVKGYATMFIGAYVYNALYSSIVGRDAAFDPIGIIEEVLQDLGLIGDDWLPKEIIEALGLADEDDEEEEEIAPFDAARNFVRNIIEELPFIGGLVGGGRIPLSSALPYGSVTELYEGTKQDLEDKNIVGLTKEWLKPIYYLVMPMGGGQLKKTVEGLQMFDDDFPVAGSYTDSGNLRFPVEDTLANRFQAGVFGQYANKNAQTYFDEGYAPLKEKQIEEYKELDLPIADYWKYREGLSGLKTLNEKGDYIGALDLPIEKKNILINNIAGRDEPIDMTDYHKYSDFEEFDFATRNPEKYTVLNKYGMSVGEYLEHREIMSKIEPLEGKEQVTLNQKGDYIGNLDLPINKKNALINCIADREDPIDMTDYHKYSDFQEFDFATRYPEKYKVLQEQGLSVKEYKEKYEESVFMYTDDFSWAANNPEQYAVSKAVSDDVTEYKKYTADLYNIKADKDKNGKSISGSRKKKVVDYINGLDIDYGAKLILFRKEYTSDDTYNYEIIDYLNGRDDISYSEMKTILEELGFKVDDKGNISW